MSAHRGPYKWTHDRTMIECEKWSETLQAWVPFGALVTATDDDDSDAVLSANIYVAWLANQITVADPDPVVVEIPTLAPVKFRRGIRGYMHGNVKPVYDTLGEEITDELDYALKITRDNPAIEALRVALDWSHATMDAFFHYASER